MAGLPACYFRVKAFSETDMTEELKKIEGPTLILHGDDDQIFRWRRLPYWPRSSSRTPS
jgi:pimeloyl-ACP methyl ester carboxylesterase